MEKTNDWVFHNTELLLKNYRDVVWSLEVATFQTEVGFRKEYGTSLEKFLELTYDAGFEIEKSDVAARVASINKSRNMLQIIDSAVMILREKHKNGELYYWILYYTYLSPKELGSVEEIINKLLLHYVDMSQRTYFRKKNDAIRQLGRLLWGYETKECLNIFDSLKW